MQVLDEFPHGPGGRSEGYDYDKMFDGHVWLLEQGEDFDCTVRSMVKGLRNAAARRGLKVRIRLVNESGVCVQRQSKGR